VTTLIQTLNQHLRLSRGHLALGVVVSLQVKFTIKKIKEKLDIINFVMF
jgi:hypothetical protein